MDSSVHYSTSEYSTPPQGYVSCSPSLPLFLDPALNVLVNKGHVCTMKIVLYCFIWRNNPLLNDTTLDWNKCPQWRWDCIMCRKPDEIGDRKTGIKEEPLVCCHGVAIGDLTLETHPRGGAAGNQCDHVDTGRKTSQTGFEGEISNPTACLGLCAKKTALNSLELWAI